MMRSCNIL